MLCRKYSSIPINLNRFISLFSIFKPKASTSSDMSLNKNSNVNSTSEFELNSNNTTKSHSQLNPSNTFNSTPESTHIIKHSNNNMSASPILHPSNVSTNLIVNPIPQLYSSENFDIQKYINSISIFNPNTDLGSLSIMKPNLYMNFGYTPIINPKPKPNSNLNISQNPKEKSKIANHDSSVKSTSDIKPLSKNITDQIIKVSQITFNSIFTVLKAIFYILSPLIRILFFLLIGCIIIMIIFRNRKISKKIFMVVFRMLSVLGFSGYKNKRSLFRFFTYDNYFSFFSHFSIFDKYSIGSHFSFFCENSFFFNNKY